MDATVTSKAQSEGIVWHSMTAEEVVRQLQSSATAGLDDADASRRLAKYGANRLPTSRTRGPLMRFLLQLNNILVYVLIGAGFIKLMMGLWLDASIILGVVVLNALLGFIQEGKAEKSLEFDPQYALPRGEDIARRGEPHDSGGAAGARRQRPAGVGRPGPSRSSPH